MNSLGPVELWLIVGRPRRGERRLRHDDATRALRTAVRGGAIGLSDLVRWLSAEDLANSMSAGPDARWRELDALLARGRVVAVERTRVLSSLSPGAVDDAEPIAEPAPTQLEPELGVATLVRVCEDWGPAVVGVGLRLDVDGALHEADTDGGGERRFEGLRPGPATLELARVDQVSWTVFDAEAEHEAPAAGLGSRRVTLDLRGAHGGPLSIRAAGINLVVVTRPWLRVMVPDLARFDHDSALLVPGPWTEGRHPLAALVHALVHLVHEPRWVLWVIGHASAPGKAAANLALSEDRADVIRALLEGDEPGWVAHARKRGSLRDVIAYLDYLDRRRGWLCAYAGELAQMDARESDETRDCVSRFQADYNDRFDGELAVDGVVGAKTLAAIYSVLRDELERWLDKLGVGLERLPLARVRYAGYGADLAGRAGGEGADRVVDLVLVDDPANTEEPEPRDIYESKIAHRLELAVPEEPNEWATGPLMIVSDLTPHEPSEPETYRLSAEDDDWLEQRVLPEDGEIRGEELVLRFDEVPTDRPLTLVVVSEAGRESVIFEGLRYGALHSSPATDPSQRR